LDDAEQQRIQITVPHSPLAGLNLKVVREFHRDNEHQLVVELPNGHTQLIPAKWIEPVADIPHAELILFSLESLRGLVRMVSKLKNHQQPEECNGSDIRDRIVDDIQPRNAPADDLSVDRSAVSANSPPSVAPGERKPR
jgi:hypothetical protein